MNVWIILGIIFYIIMVIVTYYILARMDFFDEFTYPKAYEFPTVTFVCSIFWIFIILLLIVGRIFSWIADEIAMWGYVFAEKGRMKQKEKQKEKK